MTQKDPATEKVGTEIPEGKTLTPAGEAALKVPALRLRLVEAVAERIEQETKVPNDAINHEALALVLHALAQAEQLDPNRLEILEEKVRRLEEMDQLEQGQYRPGDGEALRLG